MMTSGFDGTLLLVGAGKMGVALVEGFVRKGANPEKIIAQDPKPDDRMRQRLADLGIQCIADAGQHQISQPDVLLLAVKPQVLDEVAPTLATCAGPKTLIVSVLAGKLLAALESAFDVGQPVVRAMPNTPAAIGEGMTVCLANAHVSTGQRAHADAIFGSAGDVAWIEDEGQMDAVTAVSGSGPAYVFLLAEAMMAAGEEAGLSPKLAQQLALKTIAGAGQLLEQSPETAENLRKAVTSPAGTTAAALQVLMEKSALKGLITEAILAAKERSKTLAN